MARRNNGNQKQHSIQAMVEVAPKMETRKKEEEVIKRKVCQRKKILQDQKESHEHVIIMDLNIISVEIVIKGTKIVEDGFEGEAEDEFSWITVPEEVEKNPFFNSKFYCKLCNKLDTKVF